MGDGDPLDICVLTEREVTHGNIMVNARPIGGFRMIDGGEADDKIIAVLEGDFMWSEVRDLKDLPPILELGERDAALRHQGDARRRRLLEPGEVRRRGDGQLKVRCIGGHVADKAHRLAVGGVLKVFAPAEAIAPADDVERALDIAVVVGAGQTPGATMVKGPPKRSRTSAGSPPGPATAR